MVSTVGRLPFDPTVRAFHTPGARNSPHPATPRHCPHPPAAPGRVIRLRCGPVGELRGTVPGTRQGARRVFGQPYSPSVDGGCLSAYATRLASASQPLVLAGPPESASKGLACRHCPPVGNSVTSAKGHPYEPTSAIGASRATCSVRGAIVGLLRMPCRLEHYKPRGCDDSAPPFRKFRLIPKTGWISPPRLVSGTVPARLKDRVPRGSIMILSTYTTPDHDPRFMIGARRGCCGRRPSAGRAGSTSARDGSRWCTPRAPPAPARRWR